jgi:hypothetical protein
VELRTLICGSSSSFKCFVFVNVGLLCVVCGIINGLISIKFTRALASGGWGGGHRLHCSDAARSGGPYERSPTCLSGSSCCWCSSCQILLSVCLSVVCLHWGLISGTRRGGQAVTHRHANCCVHIICHSVRKLGWAHRAGIDCTSRSTDTDFGIKETFRTACFLSQGPCRWHHSPQHPLDV